MSKILKTASAVAIVLSTTAAVIGTDVTLAFDNTATNAVETVESDISRGKSAMETVVELQNETAAAVAASVTEASAGTSEKIETVSVTKDENGEALTVQPLPQDYVEHDPNAVVAEPEVVEAAPALRASSLRKLVNAYSMPGSLSKEMHCLAGAVYFESKGESLKGQLAVAKVVIARSESRRFPNSYCGVVFQRSQFSFVRGGRMPRINKGSRAWRNAVKIARIAHDDAWESPVEGALFFHARYVSPGWRLKRMATVDNHVFYR
ncbi:cell wall hydrolase [Sphingorhabdus sp. Alg239-R122]|uniref:cell wall hydrolase n=1 Tax=Sphingorhabdus sp. Alg239-R122 TaxID=2305989 RepID=UPI0031F6DD6B